MRIPIGKLMLMIVAAGLMTACATSFEPVPPITPVDVDAGGRALKAQNVLVILDASSSMEEGYQQWKKFDMATATVRNMAQTVPADMGIQGGLRIFGGDPDMFKNSTQLIGDVGSFDQVAFIDALSTVAHAGGPSPLPAAASALVNDLDGLDGKTAVIIVSDAKNMDERPAANAALIKEKFGDAVCFYPVLVGDDPHGQALMQRIAAIGECVLLPLPMSWPAAARWPISSPMYFSVTVSTVTGTGFRMLMTGARGHLPV